MMYKILTPFQQMTLDLLFEHGLGERGYYLTGGTALSEFYLQHRYSDDLDFFTRKQEGFEADYSLFREIMLSNGLLIASQSIQSQFARFFVTRESKPDDKLKIEFARDAEARMSPPETHGRVVIDSFEDIAVNKICAIFGRMPPESKDFCDLYFILEESSFSLEYLISRAGEKEAPFDGEDGMLGLAVNLLEADNLTMLPRMIKPLSLEILKKKMMPLGKELLSRLRPGI